jgi:NAD(P) transhydrogenase subunit alpha
MKIGVLKEQTALERRVAATPESTKKLSAMGFELLVERGAGVLAGISDQAYEDAGAKLMSGDEVLASADIWIKVRPPALVEIERAREGTLLISLIQPERNPDILEALASKKINALALERIPRITRAQKMDVLSSMGNLIGYRAVIESAANFQRFFGPQVTAAGSTPPAKVLIIGAGVAGLAAIGAARALGAEVRAFDTREAAREQVESLGATFLSVEIKESGDGGGGYSKVMSEAFIAAEMALFREQAKDIDVVITTALVPGTKAPTLLPRDVVECFRPGSVIVDLAAEQGGNCELTVPGQIVQHKGITVVGHTDMPSRMASVASRFFANNLVNLLADMGGGDGFKIDLQDEVVRPALLVHNGELLPPPPRREPSPPLQPIKSVRPPSPEAKSKQQEITSPVRRAWGSNLAGMVIIALVFLLGRFAPRDFLQHMTVFVLACFVGWQVIWSVSPSLHTPLMSVTNAISGIIVVGGMLQVGSELNVATVLGGAAVFVAAINIAGGFLVTQRMLKMFQRRES